MDENKMPENDGWKKNARLAIYAMAGFYLLTLAYQMLIGFGTINVYKNMKKNQSTDKDRNEE